MFKTVKVKTVALVWRLFMYTITSDIGTMFHVLYVFHYMYLFKTESLLMRLHPMFMTSFKSNTETISEVEFLKKCYFLLTV